MEQIAPILQQLADQLGTSAEKLWPALVAAQRADAIAGIVAFFVIASLLFRVSWWLFRAAGAAGSEGGGNYLYDNGLEEPTAAISAVLFVAGVLCLLVFICMLATPSSYLYPEAAVVRDILEML